MLLNSSPARWMEVPLPLEASVQFARVGLGCFDELLHIGHAQGLGLVGVHHHHIGYSGHQGDGAKSLMGVGQLWRTARG